MDRVPVISPGDWLLLAAAFLSFYGVGQVWLVQVSSYYLWRYVGARELPAYHTAWWRSIWFVVLAPAVSAFFASLLMLWMQPYGIPRSAVRFGVCLEALLVIGTAVWWGPLMARLVNPDGSLIQPLYRRQMHTHWLRVGLVTAYGLLVCWMLITSMAALQPAPNSIFR